MKEARDLVAGVVGLGGIGGGVATSLVNSGRKCVVYDCAADKYKEYKGCPPQVESAKKVAELADIIMVAVFNYEQCEEVIFGENGLAEGAHEGMVVVLLSTVSVDEAKILGKRCAEHAIGFLDCGVTPGSKAAENGLVGMIGGEEAVFQYAMPVLEDWSSKPILCGPVGSGMLIKVCRNANTFSIWRILTETCRICKAAGVDLNKFLEVCESADAVDNISYNIVRHRASTPDGRLPDKLRAMYPKFMSKDLHASDQIAKDLGVATPVRDLVIELIDDTSDLVQDK